MSLISQPFNPMYVKFTHSDRDYSTLYKRHMEIHSGKLKNNWIGIVGAGSFIGGVAVLALTTTWLMAFLSLLLILLWIVAPRTRLRTQGIVVFLRQKGRDDYAYHNHHGPKINWNLVEDNEIYAEAVKDWLNAVRKSNSIVINKSKWIKFLDETEKLVTEKTINPELEPDFERLNTLKELMKG